MTVNWKEYALGELLLPIDERAASISSDRRGELPVLSLTKDKGLIPQGDRFHKRIATENVDDYKLVRLNQIAYNPYVIWEGALHSLKRFPIGLVSPAYKVWQTIEDDGGFLDFLLRTKSVLSIIEGRCSGAVNRRRSIKDSDFLSIRINVPSKIEDRRKIACLVTQVNKTIESTSRALLGTRIVKRSLLNSFFSDHQWPSRPILEVCEFKGSTTSPSKLEAISENGKERVFFLKVSDMNLVGNEERITRANSEFQVSDKTLQDLNLVPPGSIILPKRGAAIATNKKRVLDYHSALDPNLMALIPGKDVYPEFLFLWSQWFDLRSITDAALLPQINKKDFVSVRFPCPSLDVQMKVCDQMAKVELLGTKERLRSHNLKILFETVEHKLLFPNDERGEA